MENSSINNQKDDSWEEDSLDDLRNNGQLLGENSINYSNLKSKRLVRSAQHTLIFNVKKLHTSKSLIKDSLLQSTCGLGNKIPRHVVTLEEKYLRHCLEQINVDAAKAARSNISENFSSLKMGSLSDGINPVKIRIEDTSDLGRFVFGCPLAAAGDGSVVIGLRGQWIVGSVMGSKSVVNILKSPLLQKLGALDADVDFRRNFNDKGKISYDFMSSPGGLSSCSSQKPEKETYTLGNYKYQSENSHKRLTSTSSTNSTCSDHSSSASAFISQGMLQCTWKSGIPHFVFSLDNQRDVYVANLSKAESALDKGMEYLYLFHSSKHGSKEHGFRDKESHLVGKMKVSTSFSISPDNSKIMETEFVLFGDSENFIDEMQASNNKHRKNKSQLKKFVDVFRSSHPSKQRGMSRFVGSSSNLEECFLEPCLDTANSSDAPGVGVNLLEEPLPPNIQLAAILVKDHLPENCPQEVGGWGLKFLKRVGAKPTIDSFGASEQNACEESNGNCSTSMDVLLPAGLHGGPKTINGGPSSLIERWRSGGHCDCGGWDLGCPLTVLKSRSTKGEVSPDTDVPEPCKLCDFFIQGSQRGAPALRIASIHDGLYFVHFQSTLSALQSFSIAVAHILTQSPALRPKNVQESKQ